MNTIPQIFAPLINHHAWGVKRIHGTILHLEFGAPHHEIREPLKPTPHLSEDARRLYFDLDAEFIVFMPKNDHDSDMWELVHNNISRVSYNTQTGFNAT